MQLAKHREEEQTSNPREYAQNKKTKSLFNGGITHQQTKPNKFKSETNRSGYRCHISSVRVGRSGVGRTKEGKKMRRRRRKSPGNRCGAPKRAEEAKMGSSPTRKPQTP
ncbi:hypothetical protein LguiB_010108 [Lonicera macranthoides]